MTLGLADIHIGAALQQQPRHGGLGAVKLGPGLRGVLRPRPRLGLLGHGVLLAAAVQRREALVVGPQGAGPGLQQQPRALHVPLQH